jgi:hypothetical protein
MLYSLMLLHKLRKEKFKEITGVELTETHYHIDLLTRVKISKKY